MSIILAPLHGFTDSTFRNVYFSHFGGIDQAVSPFISLTHGNKVTRLKVRDVLPEYNRYVPVIPQILGNDAGDFIMLCRYLSDELGYTEVNWNLGCPIKDIVRKKRGSGLLPYPELIDSLLSSIIPGIRMDLSVKLRLGLKSVDEFTGVIEVLNRYPLKSITVHPRLGIQQYEGNVMLNEFESLLPLIRHRVVYNGDIHNFDDYIGIRDRFPGIENFMLGRGVFYNPFLPGMICSGNRDLPADARKRFGSFYHDLEGAEQSTRKFWMSKMKEYWKYFGNFLSLEPSELRALMHCKSELDWNSMVELYLSRQL